jgi:hypothetical protein
VKWPPAWQLSVQLSSAREADKRWRYNYVELRVMGYSPESNDLSTEAGEFPMLEAVARERLMKTQQVGKRFSGCRGDL